MATPEYYGLLWRDPWHHDHPMMFIIKLGPLADPEAAGRGTFNLKLWGDNHAVILLRPDSARDILVLFCSVRVTTNHKFESLLGCHGAAAGLGL